MATATTARPRMPPCQAFALQVSEYLANRDSEVRNMATKALARFRYRGREYFLDDRLEEFRTVDAPWVIIPFDDDRAVRIIEKGVCVEKARYVTG